MIELKLAHLQLTFYITPVSHFPRAHNPKKEKVDVIFGAMLPEKLKTIVKQCVLEGRVKPRSASSEERRTRVSNSALNFIIYECYCEHCSPNTCLNTTIKKLLCRCFLIDFFRVGTLTETGDCHGYSTYLKVILRFPNSLLADCCTRC